ncbi:MAG: acyltransferase family protein [Desertimonas sp.]
MTVTATGVVARAWARIDRPGGTAAPSVLPGEGYIRGFDGMRALAVMLVIQGHTGYTQGRYEAFRGINDGVAVFFVMSGFLITGLLLKEERNGGIALGRFYARRALRLIPPLLVFLVGLAIAEMTGIAQVKPIAYVLALLYLTNYGYRADKGRETGHLWSLAVEEQFYLTWPLVMRFARRAALGIGLAVLAACVWLRLHPLDHPDRWSDRYFIPAVDAIVLGAVASLLIVPAARTSPRLRARLGAPEVLLGAALAYTAVKWSTIPKVSPTTSAVLLVELQKVGALFALVWICTNQRSLLVRLLELRPIAYLGRISYGVYLWQGLFVRDGPGLPQSWVHRFPANVFLSIAAAALSYELVERRVLRLKTAFAPRTAPDRS